MGDIVQFYKIVYIVAIFAFCLFLTIGGYILNRDREWWRIWGKLGKPDVKSIKELKALIKKQGYPGHHPKSTAPSCRARLVAVLSAALMRRKVSRNEREKGEQQD